MRPIIEQYVQRIKADASASPARGQFDQRSEIREISDPPVAWREQAIQLNSQNPGAIDRALKCDRRCYQQRDGIDGSTVLVVEFEPIDTDFSRMRQVDHGLGDPSLRARLGTSDEPPSEPVRFGMDRETEISGARRDDHRPLQIGML